MVLTVVYVCVHMCIWMPVCMPIVVCACGKCVLSGCCKRWGPLDIWKSVVQRHGLGEVRRDNQKWLIKAKSSRKGCHQPLVLLIWTSQQTVWHSAGVQWIIVQKRFSKLRVLDARSRLRNISQWRGIMYWWSSTWQCFCSDIFSTC